MTTRNSQRQVSLFVPERTEENDPDLWPGGSGPEAAWRVGPHPALPDVGWEWIEPYLWPYYRRTAERDAAVLAHYEKTGAREPTSGRLLPFMVPDPDNLLHRNGRPIPVDLSREDGRSLACHYQALREAKHRLDSEKSEVYERARDAHEFTCAGCEVVDRDTVRPRTVGGWVHHPPHARVELTLTERGPNLCGSCANTVELLIDERRRARAEDAAVEVLPDGRSRRDACDAFLDAHVERIM